MDERYYKQVKTQRGFTYSYYFSPPAAGKPFLLFSHGFPSASYLWLKQVAFFQPLGYGLVIPDNLGYGGTDKPTDPKLYLASGLVQDMTDILDAENIDKIIAIGHDWGAILLSRILNHQPQRISAAAFCAVGYCPSTVPLRDLFASEVFAYQRFFIHPDGAPLMEKNIDAMINVLWGERPELVKETMCINGATRACIESNRRTPLPPWMTEEDAEMIRTSLLTGGLTAPLCWYRSVNEETIINEDAAVPPAACEIHVPMLFVAFKKDYIARPEFWTETHKTYPKGPLTLKEIESDHWGVMSHPKELNEILLEWVEGLGM
ncbi:alpha/beta-hydrolase [Mycena alexandri]|uniref:Alpha/beta-hydrolase n=1 Tax=Mycena alexandri TaxID=1745969 RepID=A0AAD6XDM5_9AGAR|nr:alpha/beta-hydrolase [Mycena alexandri]